MKKIMPSFKDDTDKIIVVAVLILSMFFLFLPGLLVILFGKNYVSESSYEISKGFFNFELLLFLISLLFAVPVIGWIAGVILAPLFAIFNIIIIVIDLCAISKGAELKIPVWFEFV